LKETNEDIQLSITPNENTLRCYIKSLLNIDFTPLDSIGKLLGFNQRILTPNEIHTSDAPVKIIKINSLRIECNITEGVYLNNQKVHTIHQFFPSAVPGFKIIEVPTQVIYLPISVKSIDYLQLRIVDQDGQLVNFRGKEITIRLHIKTS